MENKSKYFYNPVEIIFSEDFIQSLKSLGEYENWMVVTSKGFVSRGTIGKIQESLNAKNLLVFDKCLPNPELEDLDNWIDSFSETKLEGIIALGGGSVIDTAKALSICLKSENSRPLYNYFMNNDPLDWNSRLPLYAIPTTSGTGSEVTPYATIWDTKNSKKFSLSNNAVFPDIAILDPNLTISLDYEVTLYSALDAISHCLDSIWNVNSNFFTKLYAESSLDLSQRALQEVLNEPANHKNREKLQKASLLAGLSISNSQTAIAHSISYPITTMYGVPHGLACSFTLPSIIEHYLNVRADKDEYELLNRTQKYLNELNLKEKIRKYVSQKQILELQDQMFHPDRSKNFCVSLDEYSLEKILISSS